MTASFLSLRCSTPLVSDFHSFYNCSGASRLFGESYKYQNGFPYLVLLQHRPPLLECLLRVQSLPNPLSCLYPIIAVSSQSRSLFSICRRVRPSPPLPKTLPPVLNETPRPLPRTTLRETQPRRRSLYSVATCSTFTAAIAATVASQLTCTRPAATATSRDVAIV